MTDLVKVKKAQSVFASVETASSLVFLMQMQRDGSPVRSQTRWRLIDRFRVPPLDTMQNMAQSNLVLAVPRLLRRWSLRSCSLNDAFLGAAPTQSLDRLYL
jgi:hypothetical protein